MLMQQWFQLRCTTLQMVNLLGGGSRGDFGEKRLQLFGVRDGRMACRLDANERLRLCRIKMRKRFAERRSERCGGQPFRSDAQNPFAEAINFVGGIFKLGRFRIASSAKHDHLNRMARMQQRCKTVGGGE